MRIIPPSFGGVREQDRLVKDKACARRKGLGTHLPWDKDGSLSPWETAPSTCLLHSGQVCERGNVDRQPATGVLRVHILNNGDAAPWLPRAAQKGAADSRRTSLLVSCGIAYREGSGGQSPLLLPHIMWRYIQNGSGRSHCCEGFVSLEGKKMSSQGALPPSVGVPRTGRM